MALRNSMLLKTLPAVAIIAVFWGCSSGREENKKIPDDELTLRAKQLALDVILVDTHVDVPYRLQSKMEDISRPTPDGNFDYPRAREGGLDAPFMSIYVPASYQKSGGAKAFADSLIDMVEKFQEDWPDHFVLARSVADVRAAFGSGRIALPMGMENGAPLEGKLANLKHFYDRGIRYITLTHSQSNAICDSSYDPNRQWHGLSPFGRKVVAEMNRLGIMVDISHVSDETFNQVIDLSQAPVIASHSSARHFTPGWERNMSDDMIERLAENGGVIQINFGSSFIREDYQKASEKRREAIQAFLKTNDLERSAPRAKEWIANYEREHPAPVADVADVADHIDHIKSLVGIDHMGIGSDFDGVGDSLPTGLTDVSAYPNLIRELLKRGYTEAEIEKITSGNLLRVWSEVERIASELQSKSHAPSSGAKSQ
ncbi:MAG: dipeptidase [Acidobacteriota bacterium]